MNNGEYRSYKITDASGVLKYRAVVAGAAEGEVAKPAAQNAARFIGITQEDQPTQNRSVLVKKSGRSFATAAGAIAYRDCVRIADNTGKVSSAQAGVDAAPGVVVVQYIIGYAETVAAADGDIIEIDINPFVVKTAAS